MTLYDKIKTMNEDELADALTEVALFYLAGIADGARKDPATWENTKKGMLNVLKQEVDE